MENNNDMSNTFVDDVGQMDAVSTGNTELVPVEEINNEVNNTQAEVKVEEPKPENNNVTPSVSTDTKPSNDNSNYYEKPPKKKGGKGLAFFLLILGLIIGGAGGYFGYTYINGKEKKVVVKKEEKKEDTTLQTEGVFVTNILERYDSLTEDDDLAFQALYNSKKTTVKTMDKDYLKYLVVRNAVTDKTLTEITSESINKSANELFGEDVTIEDSDVVLPFSKDKQVLYSYKDSIYTAKTINKGQPSNVTFYRKVTKANKTDKDLEITVAVGIFDNDADKVYTKIDEDGKYSEEVDGVTASSFDKSKDYSKLNKYKYKLEYDSDLDNYILDSIELVK